MEFSKEERIRRAKAYTELKLIKQIQNLYEDVETPVSLKKAERERLTKEFIVECIEVLSLSEREIVSVVDSIIKKEAWIKEIEEIDEEEELE